MHMKAELNAEIGMLWDVQQDTDPKGDRDLCPGRRKELPLDF